jgi:hypothetical protein
MKASKIRIVVILLLIIFFGLLILFGSRNIYEGAATATPPPADSTIYTEKTLDFSKDSGYITTLSTGVTTYSPPSGEYTIKVYFFVPKTDSSSLTKDGLPIGFINHNLPPDKYNLYFNNMNDTKNFGGNISPSTLQTSIYIEKYDKPDTDTNSVIDYARVDYATQNDKIKSLKECIINGNNSWRLATNASGKTPLVYATRKSGTKINDSHYVVKVPANLSSPSKHEYIQISTLKPVSAMTSFPIAYGILSNTNPVPYTKGDISKDVGLINLVNIYVKLK